MTNFFKKLIKDESGAAAAEYALILAIIGAGIAVAAMSLGEEVEYSVAKAENELNSANAGSGGNGAAMVQLPY